MGKITYAYGAQDISKNCLQQGALNMHARSYRRLHIYHSNLINGLQLDRKKINNTVYLRPSNSFCPSIVLHTGTSSVSLSCSRQILNGKPQRTFDVTFWILPIQ